MDLSKTDDCEFVGQNEKPSHEANNHSDSMTKIFGIRDQDAATMSARHMRETGSLN